MGDFFAPPPGYAPPPPEPDTPPPNFEAIGASIYSGISKNLPDGGLLGSLFNILVRWVTWGLGFFLSIALKVLAFIFNLMANVTDEASLGYGALVAAVLKDLFGIDVDPSTVSTRRAGPDRQAVANKLGQTITGTFFAGVQANPSGGITPSDAAANQFLAVMMNMELNGWLESWFADAASYHLLEKWGELKDGISRTLGLGRMSRQVFAPPLKVLVHDPYLALLNQKYRPKAADVPTIMKAFLRGDLQRSDLSTLLGNQGYTEQEIGWLIVDHQKVIPDADVDYLVARGIWTHEQATNYLRQQGWTDEGSQYVLQVLADKRLQKYRVEHVNVATAAYVSGEATIDQLTAILQNSGLPDDEVAFQQNNAQLRRDVHVTHLTLGQIEQGILDGVMNLGDLTTWATRNNMPADDLAFLQLMTQFKLNKQTASEKAKNDAAAAKATAAKEKSDAAAAKAAQAKAEAPDKGISVAQAEALVRAGDWTFDQLTSFLASKGYGPEAISAIELLLHQKMATTSAASSAAPTVRAAAAAKGLNLGEVEKAVVQGILTMQDLQNYLTNAGFNATDAGVIMHLTQNAVDDKNVKAAAKAAAAAAAGKKSISLPDLERAVRIGITPIAAYTTALTKAGFDVSSIDLLTGILRAQMASDAAKTSSPAPTTGQPAAKAPTLSQIGQEVANGIRPIADYTSALGKLGYDATDQQQLTDLLQARIDHGQHAAQLHSDAIGEATARGISLAAAEQAVIAGINQMADYDAMLTTLGYDDVDRSTLEALLFARVQAKAAKDGAGTTPPAA